MPSQTTDRAYMRIKDGTKISAKKSTEVSYTDLGVCKGDTGLKINWTKLQEQSANAGKSDAVAKNAECEVTFTLQNLNLANLERMSSGLFTLVSTPASANTTIPNQVIAAGWDDNIAYPLIMKTSSTDNTLLKMSTKPSLTSVVCATTSPETLVEDTDYVIVADSNAVSGWAIQFLSANFTEADPKLSAITIDYASNTPVARDTYHMGTTAATLSSFSILMEHTDSAGKVRGREIHKCYIEPGSLNFGYGGADSDGFEEMQLTITGVLDTSLTDGRQLMSVYEDTGAV